MPLLIQLVPKTHKKEIEMKFQLGQRDYAKLAAELTTFSNDARVREQRGQQDMDVDNLQREREDEQWTENDWWAYFHPDETEDLSYMGKGGWQTKGGKGKGKGKKGQGKGQGKWGGKSPQPAPAPAAPPATPAGGQPTQTQRYCYWCHKQGHFKRDCKIFLAGQPKLPKPDRPAGSLEQGQGEAGNDWEEEQDLLEEEMKSLELEMQCMECEEQELNMMENAGDFTFDAGHFEHWEAEETDDGDDEILDAYEKFMNETESGGSRITPLTSLVHGETPSWSSASTASFGRVPLLPHMRTDTGNVGMKAKEESLLDKIKREQNEMRISIKTLMAKVDSKESPPGLEEYYDETNLPKRKNRNQSAKKKRISINAATEDDEDKIATVATAETGVQHIPTCCNAETQTTYSLPSTCRDVI